MRLIDADALYIPAEEMNAKMAVAYAPTIDAVPIVRCKNCKYYDEQTFMGHSMGWASCSGRFADVDDHGIRFKIPSEDWFCADGVKRDEDATD